MVSTSDFRKGSTKILHRGEPWLVIGFTHVKPGKGGAFVRTKLRNLKNGNVLDETFRSGEKFEAPDLAKTTMQYLYKDGDMYNFMDQENYEQISLSQQQLLDVEKYLKETEVYDVLFFEGQPIVVDPPTFMILTVAETIPGVKGDTAQGGSKPATLESGVVVQVPLFVNEGDRLKIDTRDAKYIERVTTEKNS
jgi:elongation factor P